MGAASAGGGSATGGVGGVATGGTGALTTGGVGTGATGGVVTGGQAGIGFDRTASGSNAVEQYSSQVRQELSSRDSIPDDLLLFFHHVGWQEPMSSGRTLWEELVYRYSLGVDQVGEMRGLWTAVQGRIDTQRFDDVVEFLQIQHWEARWWRDACLQYFRQFANLQIPGGYAEPANPLSYYQGLSCPTDPTKPRCNAVYTGDPSPAILP